MLITGSNLQGITLTGSNVVIVPTTTTTTTTTTTLGPGPTIGTTFAWTSDTYFDSWTSQTATDSDLSITGAPGISGYNTNLLVWQVFYAHQSVELTVASNKWGYVPYASGTNSIGLRASVSTVNNALSNFAADSVIATTTSNNYTGDSLNQRAITTKLTVPASRYFLLGMVGGPFYRMFKTLASNRTATISGNPAVTVLNRFYWPGWPSGPSTGIPSQLGGAGSFTQVLGYVPVLSFKFTTV